MGVKLHHYMRSKPLSGLLQVTWVRVAFGQLENCGFFLNSWLYFLLCSSCIRVEDRCYMSGGLYYSSIDKRQRHHRKSESRPLLYEVLSQWYHWQWEKRPDFFRWLDHDAQLNSYVTETEVVKMFLALWQQPNEWSRALVPTVSQLSLSCMCSVCAWERMVPSELSRG